VWWWCPRGVAGPGVGVDEAVAEGPVEVGEITANGVDVVEELSAITCSVGSAAKCGTSAADRYGARMRWLHAPVGSAHPDHPAHRDTETKQSSDSPLWPDTRLPGDVPAAGRRPTATTRPTRPPRLPWPVLNHDVAIPR
jgi:hypothetical protein